MHVFSRTITLAPGDVRKQMEWAVRITEKVNQISEIPIRLWSVVMSGDAGQLGWGLSVPTLAGLEALDDKLTADSGYLDLVTEGAQYVRFGPTDMLVRLLYADPTINVDRTQYIQTATAVASPGELAAAVEVGVEIAQKASAVSGCPGTFGVHSLGTMGTVQWSTYFESIEQYEHGVEAVNADEAFQQLTSRRTEGLFIGTASLTLVRKVI
jgi:hypothetical protein